MVGTPSDPWVAAALSLPSTHTSRPAREALLSRIVLEFFRDTLDGYHRYCFRTGARRSCSSSGGFSSLNGLLTFPGASIGAGDGVVGLFPNRAASVAGSFGSGDWGRVSLTGAASVQIDSKRWLGQHLQKMGVEVTLHEQLLQGACLSQFLEEYWGPGDPYAWYAAGVKGIKEWQAAEELICLQKQLRAQPLGLYKGANSAIPQTADAHQPQQLDQQSKSYLLPQLASDAEASGWNFLSPPIGTVHKSFPPLITADAAVEGPGVKLRRGTGSAKGKTRPSVGRRRAISELMVRIGIAMCAVAWLLNLGRMICTAVISLDCKYLC